MSKNVFKHISIFLILCLFGSNAVPLVFAETVITPTLYCVGGVGAPPCNPVNPSITTPLSPQPTSPSNTFQPSSNPCNNQSNSVQDDTAQYRKHHHKHSHGHNNGFFSMLIEFLLKLIQLLLGGSGIQLPNPSFPSPSISVNPSGSVTPSQPCYPTTNPSSQPSQPAVTTSITNTPTYPVGVTSSPTNAVTGCTQADIQKLVDSVSQANIEKNLKELVQDDSKPTPNELISRHVSSPGNQQKVDWAKQQMTSYGLQIVDQPFTSGGRNLQNLVARINGTDQNSFYTVGGHIDSISESPDTTAPGADDDGSGVVVAMEVGRVMKSFEKCMKSSIDIAGWNDEEEEMNGSPSYISALNGKTIKGAISMDMVGYQPSNECLKSDYKEAARDQSMAQKIVDMNAKYNIGLNVSATLQSDFSDDASSFWDANIPAAYLIECTTETNSSAYPGYHKTSDKTTNVNFAQLAKTAKLIVAALAELTSQ